MPSDSLHQVAQLIFANETTPQRNALLGSASTRLQDDPDSPLTLLIAGRAIGLQARQKIIDGEPAEAVNSLANACFQYYDKAANAVAGDPVILQLIARDMCDLPPLSKRGLYLVANVGPSDPSAIAHYVGALKMVGRIDDLAAEFGRWLREGETDPFGLLKAEQSESFTPAAQTAVRAGGSLLDAARALQADNIAAGRKSLLICSQPKSGTIFIGANLMRCLKLLNFGISVDYWPDSVVIEDYARLFAEGGAVCVDHIGPSERNLDILREVGMDRAWVHVRDPRQGCVSWYHHIKNNLTKGRYYWRHFENPPIPEDYDDWSEDAKTDWIVDTFFPKAWGWIVDWWRLSLSDDGFSVAFSQQERMRDDPVTLLNGILEFFGDDARLTPEDVPPPKRGVDHFRTGATDEWRTAFGDAQKARMWSMMAEHPDVCERFGWTE